MLVTFLACLSILFSQYKSCDYTQESIFFQSWTFSCSHAVSLVNRTKVQTSNALLSHNLYWKNKINKRKKTILDWYFTFLGVKKNEGGPLGPFGSLFFSRIFTTSHHPKKLQDNVLWMGIGKASTRLDTFLLKSWSQIFKDVMIGTSWLSGSNNKQEFEWYRRFYILQTWHSCAFVTSNVDRMTKGIIVINVWYFEIS